MVRPLFAALGLVLLLSGCTNTLKYDAVNRPVEVQSKLGITDLQDMVNKMADSMLTHPGTLSYILAKRPRLAVDPLTNLTGRELAVDALTASLQDRLLLNDSFTLVDAKVMTETRKRLGLGVDVALDDRTNARMVAQNVNADLLISGEVSEVIRARATQRDVLFRINLRLVERASGGIVWQDEREYLKSQKKTVYGI